MDTHVPARLWCCGCHANGVDVTGDIPAQRFALYPSLPELLLNFNCMLQQVDGVISHALQSQAGHLEYITNTDYYRAFKCAFSSGICKALSLHSCLLINKGLCSDITYVLLCLSC